MLHAQRTILIAAAAACVALSPALGDDAGAPAPRQSRPQQLAQSCRMLCVEELNACTRTCDDAAIRIDCLAQCQTRFNLCNSACR